MTYTGDVLGVWADEGRRDAYYLDNIDLTTTADLERLLGWTGATAHVHVLNNLGGMPNDTAGTLQGVDNIEVSSQRLRLFEAWLGQQLGENADLRLGLYDLNSEFYTTDAAGLLIAPAFGIGSEVASTGPNGPSIFPSTALAVRLDVRPTEGSFVRAAVLNASAGTIGDVQGVDLSFDNGALLIAEAGVEGPGRLALGVWGYTSRHDDIRLVDPAGDPVQRRARGGYVVAEHPLNDPEAPRALTAFARAGLSDGKTTPFRGGWQAGLLMNHVFNGREDSALSFGANQGYLSRGYRRTLADDGIRAASAETAFELTYSDRVAGLVTLQPDLQLVLDPGGDKDADPVIVAGLRLTIEL